MSDELTFDGARLEDVVLELRDLGDGARQRLFAAVTEQAVIFQQVVREDKLSGQVLNAQTGNLRDSIFQTVTDGPEGVTAEIGSSVIYAAIHEFGGIIEPVNAPVLRFEVGGQVIHAMRVVMPERSYLRSTLGERAAIIRAALLDAVLGRPATA